MNNLQEITRTNLPYKTIFPVGLTENIHQDVSVSVFDTGSYATVFFGTKYYSDSTLTSVKLVRNMCATFSQPTRDVYATDGGDDYTMFNIIQRLSYDEISFDERILPYLEKKIRLVNFLNLAKKELNSYFTEENTWFFVRPTYSLDGVVLEIHTSQDGATALATLEKFEDEWWINNMPVNSDKILIDVVFA